MTAILDPNVLGEVALFKGLSQDDLATLKDLMHRKTFASGTNIITAEQVGEVVYLILSGTVKIHIEQADGTDVIIAILGAGDIVGEMSLLDNTGRCANVVTLEQSTLLWMDRAAFQECMQKIPAITFNLARILAGRLRLANEQIQSLATLEVESRVARQILAFGQLYGRVEANGDVFIPIRLTQSDIAGMVGASRERINQVMVSYKQRKYISVDHNHHITVHNQKALANRCQ